MSINKLNLSFVQIIWEEIKLINNLNLPVKLDQNYCIYSLSIMGLNQV